MAKKKKSPQKSSPKKKATPKIQQTDNSFESRKPILKFAGTFLGTCLLFFLLTNMPWFQTFRAPILSFYSGVSGFLLNLFGYNISTNGPLMSSSAFSVSIEEGCDAIAPAILYAISVGIFPIAWSSRWRGIVFGLLAIAALNIVRIISLFMTGVHARGLFDFMHVDFWQAVFIVFTVGIWIYWMRWATNRAEQTQKG